MHPGMQYLWIQVYSDEGHALLHWEIITKYEKTLTKFKKSSPEPLGQYQSNWYKAFLSKRNSKSRLLQSTWKYIDNIKKNLLLCFLRWTMWPMGPMSFIDVHHDKLLNIKSRSIDICKKWCRVHGICEMIFFCCWSSIDRGNIQLEVLKHYLNNQ